ncbi:Uma2 family endonuclease [Virgibacillus halophilus]
MGCPDLIIEIISPSTATIDRIDKQAYGKGGVKEYWKWVQQTNW